MKKNRLNIYGSVFILLASLVPFTQAELHLTMEGKNLVARDMSSGKMLVRHENSKYMAPSVQPDTALVNIEDYQQPTAKAVDFQEKLKNLLAKIGQKVSGKILD